MTLNLRKTIFLAMMTSIAIVLSVVESMISSTLFLIPGVKLGLSNIVTIVILYRYSWKEASVVVVIRILLAALISPVATLVSFALSSSGGIVALLTMVFIQKTKIFSILGVSVAGSLMHMVGQLLLAMVLLDTPTLIYYLPYMLLLSVPTGIVTGLASKTIIHSFLGHQEPPQFEKKEQESSCPTNIR